MVNSNRAGVEAPMKRIKHSTTIEEPHGFQQPQSPAGFHGFLQNMVHPAFRTMAPGEAPPNPGMMGPVQMPNPNQPRIAAPMATPGFHPIAPPQPFMQNPGQMDWSSLLGGLRSGGANPYLLQFLQRMAQGGMR